MTRRLEVLTTLLLISLGVTGYLEAHKIAGFSFDPIGSKAFPIGISLLLVALCCLILFSALFRRKNNPAKEKTAPAHAFLRILGMLTLIIFYIITVFSLRLPLSLMTLCFVLLASSILPMEVRSRGTFIALLGGLILGFASEWVFTRFFFVDLPTLW